MRNKSKKMLIIALVTTLIFGGLSPMFFATATPEPPQWPNILHIEWVDPESILEGDCEFEVKVVNIGDPYKPPVEGAWVMVDDPNGPDFTPVQTNINGIAEFDQHMEVDEDTIFTVYASKNDWQFDGEYKYLTVRNKVLHFYYLPEWMDEQTWDHVIVHDQDNQGIGGVLINFGGYLTVTWSSGYALLYALDVTAEDPFVDPWVTVPITASKGIYEPAIGEIQVRDLDDTPSYVDCYVWNRIGGDPIEDATVRITQGGEGQETTNEDGYCQLTVLPDELFGTFYIFKASALGFWPKHDIGWLFGGYTYRYDFNLWPRIFGGDVADLEVTSATSEPRYVTVEFEATISQDDVESVIYSWDYGDDTFDETDSPINSHDYVELGYYIVSVTATITDPSDDVSIEYGEIGLEIH